MKKIEKNLFFSMTYEFLEVYMRLQLERSPAAIESYRDALTVFRHYLRDQRNIHLNSFEFSQCTKDLVLDFMEHLSAIGNKPGTRNQRLAALKSYLWFAADKNVALQSIAISISRVKACRNPKKEKPILDEEALRLLFDAPGNSKMGVRDKTIMILLYDSAARIDEVLSLKKQDIYLSSSVPSIHVLGKGQKERVIALTEQTCSHLQQYLSIYHPQNGPDTDLLFYTIINCVHPHMLRRTRATGLYRDGVDLSIVSRFLGHAQLETMRIYSTPSVEMMREVIEKASVNLADKPPIWNANTDEAMARMCGVQ